MTQPMKHTKTSMMLASESLRRLKWTPESSPARAGPRQTPEPSAISHASEAIEAASAKPAP